MDAGNSGLSSVECIYCRENKPESAYTKVDHVLPQSFGKFENNLTLIRLVYDACNQFFGDNVELALARDTLEGQSRVDFGVKRAEEFISPGRRSRIRIEIAEGKFKGAHAFRDYSEADNSVTLQPVPQVGFRQRESTEFKYFLLDELPDKMQLVELGLDLKYIRAVGVTLEELEKKLADKEISFRHTGNVRHEDASMLCRCRAQLTIQFFAALRRLLLIISLTGKVAHLLGRHPSIRFEISQDMASRHPTPS